MDFRTEKDALGEVQVPKDAYYGSFTARALKNFDLSGERAPAEFAKSLALIKSAAADTNTGLGLLDKKVAKAIVEAAHEFG